MKMDAKLLALHERFRKRAAEAFNESLKPVLARPAEAAELAVDWFHQTRPGAEDGLSAAQIEFLMGGPQTEPALEQWIDAESRRLTERLRAAMRLPIPKTPEDFLKDIKARAEQNRGHPHPHEGCPHQLSMYVRLRLREEQALAFERRAALARAATIRFPRDNREDLVQDWLTKHAGLEARIGSFDCLAGRRLPSWLEMCFRQFASRRWPRVPSRPIVGDSPDPRRDPLVDQERVRVAIERAIVREFELQMFVVQMQFGMALSKKYSKPSVLAMIDRLDGELHREGRSIRHDYGERTLEQIGAFIGKSIETARLQSLKGKAILHGMLRDDND